ncbi:MAG: hypothetical protein HY854_17265 [Burkholderiales bacterium]|nr:hypothetical protein [Burkholderiales bacterium]
MKFLVLLGILLVAYLIWRHSRVERRDDEAPPPKQQPAAAPQDMVSCPICSVHLPRGDAVAGADGRLFCSQEHRLTAGQ